MMEAVILYSSNDFRFFNPCIKNLLDLNIPTHVVTYSHMWAGHPEDFNKLRISNELFLDNPNYHAYQIDWHPGQSSWYWEGLGRYLATQRVSDSSDYILYIDIDEIIDPIKFIEWKNTFDYTKFDTMKLPDYWYWRDPIHRSKVIQYNTVMTKTALAKSLPFSNGGREIYFNSSGNSTLIPKEYTFIHHYSWVRTKAEMINKVMNWGHNADRGDWISKVEEEYSRPFNGTDFMFGYEYDTVENIFNV